jgi:anaerobic selenocysteine-containing dehydrogenase
MDRRQFLASTGKGVGGALAAIAWAASTPRKAAAFPDVGPVNGRPLKIGYATDTTSICPYCGVGCGLLVSSKDGKIINIEGDPDHPINEGALCSKGGSVFQVAHNERRLDKVRYRAPGASEWQEVDWDWAIDKITRNYIKTRNETFVKDENGVTVNRTDGVACFGGAALDNEECYLLSKLTRAMGMVQVEHQARI